MTSCMPVKKAFSKAMHVGQYYFLVRIWMYLCAYGHAANEPNLNLREENFYKIIYLVS